MNRKIVHHIYCLISHFEEQGSYKVAETICVVTATKDLIVYQSSLTTNCSNNRNGCPSGILNSNGILSSQPHFARSEPPVHSSFININNVLLVYDSLRQVPCRLALSLEEIGSRTYFICVYVLRLSVCNAILSVNPPNCVSAQALNAIFLLYQLSSSLKTQMCHLLQCLWLTNPILLLLRKALWLYRGRLPNKLKTSIPPPLNYLEDCGFLKSAPQRYLSNRTIYHIIICHGMKSEVYHQHLKVQRCPSPSRGSLLSPGSYFFVVGRLHLITRKFLYQYNVLSAPFEFPVIHVVDGECFRVLALPGVHLQPILIFTNVK